ncbi:glucosyltransferase [Massospora cicadina]|nr:glucosyltransferase [Massospora cicadina]
MVTGYLVNKHVPEPYMDEIFHIDQVQRYCRKEWGWYHPKLTTPPGLYVLSLPLTAFVGCEVTGLRFINQLLGMALYWVAACFTSEGDRLEPWTQPLTVLAAGVSPIGLFFHHLYYTDSASTLSVLLGVLLANRGHHWASALACGAFARDARLPRTHVAAAAFQTRSVSLVLQVALPYSLVVISFALFLVVNGGVVLGDKANHVTGLHFPQLGYYLVYASAMLWPHFITASAPVSIYRALASILSTPRFAALLVGVLAVVTALLILYYPTSTGPSTWRRVGFGVSE